MPTLIYRERVLPGPMVFIAPLVVAVMLFATLLPLDQAAALAWSLSLLAVAEAALIWRAPVIELTENHLRVGRARIDRALLGKATLVEAEEAFAEKGHLLDARAFTCFQGSVRTLVKVVLNDPRDPAPYWLFSSRNAGTLIQLLA